MYQQQKQYKDTKYKGSAILLTKQSIVEPKKILIERLLEDTVTSFKDADITAINCQVFFDIANYPEDEKNLKLSERIEDIIDYLIASVDAETLARLTCLLIKNEFYFYSQDAFRNSRFASILVKKQFRNAGVTFENFLLVTKKTVYQSAERYTSLIFDELFKLPANQHLDEARAYHLFTNFIAFNLFAKTVNIGEPVCKTFPVRFTRTVNYQPQPFLKSQSDEQQKQSLVSEQKLQEMMDLFFAMKICNKIFSDEINSDEGMREAFFKALDKNDEHSILFYEDKFDDKEHIAIIKNLFKCVKTLVEQKYKPSDQSKKLSLEFGKNLKTLHGFLKQRKNTSSVFHFFGKKSKTGQPTAELFNAIESEHLSEQQRFNRLTNYLSNKNNDHRDLAIFLKELYGNQMFITEARISKGTRIGWYT